jgi:hypothetical protein
LAFIPPLLSPVRTLERIPEMPSEEPTVAESMAAGDGLVEPGGVPHAIAETRSLD